MIKGGVKNESEFCPYSFSHSKLCSFLFSFSEKFVVKIKFLFTIFCSCEFYRKHHEILFICKQGHGGEEEVSISVVYTYVLALSFLL